MPEFLTTSATVAQIENIISNAKKTLVLVSPYIQLSRNLLDRLKDADDRGVKIILVYREDKLQPDEKRQIEDLKNLSLFFCDRLHAKCYFNDDSMVITSLNLYEYSEKKNLEMGVLLRMVEDESVFKAATREVKLIIRTSQKEARSSEYSQQKPESVPIRDKAPNSLPRTEKRNVADILRDALGAMFAGEKLDAYCIRCGDRLPFDPPHALCDACYYKWSDYDNPNYPEHYCHACGNLSRTTKDRPLCASCYSRLRR